MTAIMSTALNRNWTRRSSRSPLISTPSCTRRKTWRRRYYTRTQSSPTPTRAPHTPTGIYVSTTGAKYRPRHESEYRKEEEGRRERGGGRMESRSNSGRWMARNGRGRGRAARRHSRSNDEASRGTLDQKGRHPGLLPSSTDVARGKEVITDPATRAECTAPTNPAVPLSSVFLSLFPPVPAHQHRGPFLPAPYVRHYRELRGRRSRLGSACFAQTTSR